MKISSIQNEINNASNYFNSKMHSNLNLDTNDFGSKFRT